MEKKKSGSCHSCVYYIYDDEYEEYYCDVSMDEDEYMRMHTDSRFECPYYRSGDDYKIVRKQM